MVEYDVKGGHARAVNNYIVILVSPDVCDTLDRIQIVELYLSTGSDYFQLILAWHRMSLSSGGIVPYAAYQEFGQPLPMDDSPEAIASTKTNATLAETR
jgi:hypothetical protein